MKQERTFIGIILAVFVVSMMSACSSQTQQAAQGGRAVFTMTDAAVNIGDVTNVWVTIDSVKVLSKDGAWTQVSTQQHTYDLIQLKTDGNQVLLADYNITPGNYTQERLVISKVIVADASGNHTAKLPSGELKLVGMLKVNANSTSAVNFDFIADESLHMTGNGTYIFAPVIHVETREKASADTSFNEHVRVSGEVSDSRKQSMGTDGNMSEGLKIKRDANLSIKGDRITEDN